MSYQVYGSHNGYRVLVGWNRKSLKAALDFARRRAKHWRYTDLSVVGPKGRVWQVDSEHNEGEAD